MSKDVSKVADGVAVAVLGAIFSVNVCVCGCGCGCRCRSTCWYRYVCSYTLVYDRLLEWLVETKFEAGANAGVVIPVKASSCSRIRFLCTTDRSMVVVYGI